MFAVSNPGVVLQLATAANQLQPWLALAFNQGKAKPGLGFMWLHVVWLCSLLTGQLRAYAAAGVNVVFIFYQDWWLRMDLYLHVVYRLVWR